MVQIRGIEVTQAIQYYRSSEHLSDPADRGPDNSVPLIADKPAWVRVYVESETGTDIPDVTGQLTVRYGPLNQKSGPPLRLMPKGSGVVIARAYPDYTTIRSTPAATLNFVIPRDRMSGLVVLNVEVSIGSGPVLATKSITIAPNLRQTLKLRGVMIGYSGPNLDSPPANTTVNAPTLDDLQKTAAWALRVMPVSSSAIFEIASTIQETTPLAGDIANGRCPPSWVDLNSRVAQARLADGNRPDYIYYGLLPKGFPNSGNALGCEASDVASGFVGDANQPGQLVNQVAMAHEISHNCGLLHAPCGTSIGTPDPNYPAYEPYETPTAKRASIGEFGLDISTGLVPTPDTARDYMSYCVPFWVSLYTYRNLIANPKLNPQTVGTRWWEGNGLYDPWWFLDYDPGYPPLYWFDRGDPPERRIDMMRVIAITGTRDPIGVVRVTHIVRTEVFSEELPGTMTDLAVQLMDTNGAVLASAPLRASPSQAGCGCQGSNNGASQEFLTGFLPDVAPGIAIVIKRNDATLWERRAPVRAVEVRDLQTKRQRGGLIQFTWKVDWPDREKGYCWLRYSTDRGRTWKSAAVDLRGDRTTIDASHLPAGRILVQVSAHDGFYSAHSKPAVLVNDVRPPSLAILNPPPGRSLVAGEALHLWGSAAGQPGSSEDDLDFVWSIDDKQIGDELEVFTTVPSPGRHRAKLVCKGHGKRILGTAEIEFKSVSDRVGSAKRRRTRH